MRKIRDLIIPHPNKKLTKAYYYLGNNQDIYFVENDIYTKGYKGHKYGCKDCIYSEFILPKSHNSYSADAYICKKFQEKSQDFDIALNLRSNNPVCRFFEPKGYFSSDNNINAFINIKNCCYLGNSYIDSISYKDCQIPISFIIKEKDWWNLEFINNNTILINKPLFHNKFLYKSEECDTLKEYAKVNNFDKKQIEELKCILNSNYIKQKQIFDNKIFNFETMWFI